MVTLKPRSLVACSPIAVSTVTGWPAWRISTSLMFCAQMVGKPVIAPEPAAAPTAPLSTPRRVMPVRVRPGLIVFVMLKFPQAAMGRLIRDFMSGWMRVPNCSMPMMKSSKVSIAPATPGTAPSSSIIFATLA